MRATTGTVPSKSGIARARALWLGLVAAVAGGCAQGGWSAFGFDLTSDAGPVGGEDGSSDPGDAGHGESPIQPSFGPTVLASVPPPPISGGTLIVTHDGSMAIAADPDRDAVYGVNLASSTVTYTVKLKAGDEPGRLAEDGSGRVHVALRSGGALVTIDEKTGAILGRRAVCPAPRGVAWDSGTDRVWVACATGELVALPAWGGAATTNLRVERDLRDVILDNGTIAISELRAAQVLRLDGKGAIARRDQLPSPEGSFVPHVAWRAVAGPSGTIVAVHQAESTTSLQIHVQGGYGSGGCGGGGGIPQVLHHPASVDAGGTNDAGNAVDDADLADGMGGGGDAGCGLSGGDGGNGDNQGPDAGGCFGPDSAAVMSVLTILGSDGSVLLNTPFTATLPVDVAVSRDGSMIAAVAPGDAFVTSLASVFWFAPCGDFLGQQGVGANLQPVAAAFDAQGHLVVQTREPAALWIYRDPADPGSAIALSHTSRGDTGHDIFHTQAGAMIACASCHPEGRDDGHVWLLDGNLRRTPSLRGTIAGTAPYHWPGDEPDLTALVNDVYTVRMDGASLPSDQMHALQGWVQTIPAPPAPSWVDSSAAARGKALFMGVGSCSICHSGPKLTNNQTMQVGTGGDFQVPSLLGVGWNTPLLHDGCAATLADRFGRCGTAEHGTTSSLSAQNLSDLIAFLETL
jgi:hypothetical protein